MTLYFFLFIGCSSPRSHDAWIEATTQKNLGLAYLDRNDFDSAVQAFEAVTRLVPDDPLGYANLAVALLNRQEPEKAEENIRRALVLAPGDGQALAIEADIAFAQDNPEKTLSLLEKAIEKRPADILLRYRYLTLTARLRGDAHDPQTDVTQLRAILDVAPDNLATLAQLAETLVRTGRTVEAETEYHRIAALLPDADETVRSQLDLTLAALHIGPPGETQRRAAILGNLLKADPVYRDARDRLGDVSQNSPAMADFRTAPPDLITVAADSLISVTFVDAGPVLDAAPAPDARLAVFDAEADGFPDLAVIANSTVRLYRNTAGVFAHIDSPNLVTVQDARYAVLGDVDNDGDADLVLFRADGTTVFRQETPGRWRPDRSVVHAGGGEPSGVSGILADYDHDGDLDVVISKKEGTRLLRNADAGQLEDAGTLPNTSNGEMSTPGQTVYGDFDLDGALDLFAVRPGAGARLYRNGRQGRMIDATQSFGLRTVENYRTAVAGDFNNDGAFDLFLGGAGPGKAALLWNETGPRFDVDSTPAGLSTAARGLDITAVVPVDFDNDGFLDLLIAGQPSSGVGLRLVRNRGAGRFEDVSSLLPSDVIAGACLDVAVADYDGDGDMDIVAYTAVGVRLLRNDGGNANQWLKIRLEASLAGSGKNNFYGVGSTIEINAGTHYQALTVFGPYTHVGIGKHPRADVYRVLWTNGVPQNTVSPETRTTVVERQRLKGSCPSLYTWNGSEYVFVTHLMTRSAIGALTETGASAPPDAANDYVIIQADQLKPKDGRLTLRVVEELWDAVYMDRMELLAVDHPESIDVYVDEKYLPPPYPGLELLTATHPRLPVSAYDRNGRDVLPHLAARDTLYAGDFALGRYQGTAELHSITLDLGKLPAESRIQLYLCGWIMPIEPSTHLALSQRRTLGVVPPYLEVPDANGRWRTVIPYTGFPSGEHKTMMIDLTGKFLANDHRVRITTDMQIYWSEAFFTVDEPERLPMTVTRLKPEMADLRFRGFSREYRVASNGPFLRDYDQVSTAPQWLPFTGYRTRYGDVAPLLSATDDQYAIFGSGEEIVVSFDTGGLPSLPAGWRRDYVLHTDGWLKEGDLNTKTAATIEPLPFHGMKRYPYGADESYPITAEHTAYRHRYNTRWVSQRIFRDQLRRYGDAAARIGN
ncbi:MAG: VCBS repeat-containing protein [candidate division Zixibacteria bacterium]|nr:VCBS repeat-containing protein [candidate division Zixibacteria bacterium]